MKKHFNIITNLESGAGLRCEYEILRVILESAGHRVMGVDFRQAGQAPSADINLFLETVVERMFGAAIQNWVMPNPEFWLEEYQQSLPRLSRVLCKTQHAFKLFQDLAGDRAQYVGFMSRDLLQSEVRRKPKFLHLAGNSPFKNTEIVLRAWRKLPFQLTLVSGLECFRQQASKLENVRIYDRVSEEKLRYLMNSRQFHLCPSQYEGFGHYIHEALSVGAIVLTIDVPPMNELGLPAELLMPCIPDRQLRLATLHKITHEVLRNRVQTIVDLSSRRLREFSRRARDLFEKECEEFPRRLLAVVDSKPSHQLA